MKVTKEVSWAYRLGRPNCTAISFVTGKGREVLPSKKIWDQLRKEVNKQRRAIRARKHYQQSTQARASRREYMRAYMRERRAS